MYIFLVSVVNFGAVSVRYIPFQRLCGKRAGALKGTWYPVYMLGIGYFLCQELAQFPNPSKRMPDSFRVLLPYWVNVPAHAAVWLSYFLTCHHLYQFRAFRRYAEEVVDLTFDILLLPVTFGLLALHCIRILPDRGGHDIWGATATLDCAEMWESWALWSFQTLFIRYVEGSEDSREQLFGPFKQICLLGVQQYVVFNFASNALEMVWREVDRYAPENCARIWHQSMPCQQVYFKIQDYLIGALWYSCSIAIYSILCFEVAMSRSLKPISPYWKFWGAKAIVTVAGIQRLILFSFTTLGILDEAFAWYVHAYLLCYETLFLTGLHFWAYPASGYFKAGRQREATAAHLGPAPAVYGKVEVDSPASGGDEELEHIIAGERVAATETMVPAQPTTECIPRAIGAKICPAPPAY